MEHLQYILSAVSAFSYWYLGVHVSLFSLKCCKENRIIPLYMVGKGRAERPWLCICLCCSRRLLASRTGFSNWVLRLMWLKEQCRIENNGNGLEVFALSQNKTKQKTKAAISENTSTLKNVIKVEKLFHFVLKLKIQWWDYGITGAHLNN